MPAEYSSKGINARNSFEGIKAINSFEGISRRVENPPVRS
jgi:hypothetical protein